MEESFLSNVVLPLAIVIIMIAMGMTLTVADFRRVLSQPKAVAVGMLCQLIVLPILGFLVASILPLEAIFAVSVILLAASPGGTTSNLVSHAAELDRALSVTLTAISNLLSWLTIPLLLGFALRYFAVSDEAVSFPVADVMLQVAGLTFVPILLGMGIHQRWPGFAEVTKKGSKIFAGLFLLVVIVALVIQNWEVVKSEAPRFAVAFILLNVIALGAGLLIARLFGLGQIQAITIAIETGLQNSTVAITVALSILGSSEMTVIPALYGIWMLATGFGFAFLLNRSGPTAAVPAQGA